MPSSLLNVKKLALIPAISQTPHLQGTLQYNLDLIISDFDTAEAYGNAFQQT